MKSKHCVTVVINHTKKNFMKKILSQKNAPLKMWSLFVMFIMTAPYTWAQNSPNVKVNGNDVGSWFGSNWIWVVGLVALLVVILMISGGSSSKRSTTVVSDRFGDVKQRNSSETIVD